MMELNDYELLDKVSEDEFATEVLFKKYRPLIYNTAKKFYYGNKDSGIDLNELTTFSHSTTFCTSSKEM